MTKFHVLQNLAIKRKRFARFGHSPLDPLPVASFAFRQACEDNCCSPLASSISRSAKAFRTERDGKFFGLLKDTAAVIDLSLFPTAEAYLKAVSRETSGKYHRSANKARRAGYYTRRIALSSHAQSHFDIKASKRERSQGVVLQSTGVLPRPERDDGTPPPQPACNEHWNVEWGVFNHADDKMWGFATLVRSGNMVQIDNMMAHADVLKLGAMKLLQFDMMAWILGRADPLLSGGVDYLLHGAIEDGGDGAADWRRYLQQRPFVLRLSNPEQMQLPADFDPKTYLALHRDLRESRADPREHYLRHGITEGRQYKIVSSSAPDRPAKLNEIRRLTHAICVQLFLGAVAASAVLSSDASPLFT